MNKEVRILYIELAQEDRDKVDAQIRELFSKQQKQLEAEGCSNIPRQEACH